VKLETSAEALDWVLPRGDAVEAISDPLEAWESSSQRQTRRIQSMVFAELAALAALAKGGLGYRWDRRSFAKFDASEELFFGINPLRR